MSFPSLSVYNHHKLYDHYSISEFIIALDQIIYIININVKEIVIDFELIRINEDTICFN